MIKKDLLLNQKNTHYLFLFFLLSTFISFSSFASISTDYFRSKNTGTWNNNANWESSSDNSSWGNSTLIPTSSAQYITIQTGHTITIDASVSASTISIDGSATLTFDGIAVRNVTVQGDIIVANTLGSFITQSAGSFVNTLTITGNISNQGTLDFSRGGTTLVCDITFNKNGNQTITGTGTTTRFNEMNVNMGTSNANILEISTSNFSAPNGFLETASGVANRLKNGTLKLSGSFTYSGTPFIPNTFNNTIVSTAGFWINNPNVTITAYNDTFDVSGKLQVSQGTMSIGTTVGSCLKYATGSTLQIDGGNLNVISRIQGTTVAVSTTNFIQSGGVITLLTSNINASGTAGLDFTAATSTFIMSGGKIIFQNENGSTNKDVNIQCSTTITGGTFQFGNSSTLNIPDGFIIQSDSYLPSIEVYSISVGGIYPTIKLTKNALINGTITIENGCTLDVSSDGGTTNFDYSLTGNFINNGIFTQRNKSVSFIGTTAQSISGTTSTQFNNLLINNSSTGITLNSPISVTGGLTLTNGKITSSTLNTITLNTGATSTSGSTASFVDGPMVKIGNTDFIFPLGNGSQWRRIKAFNLSGLETYTAQYFNSAYSNVSNFNPELNPLSSVSNQEYWTLTQAGNANASIELFWENATTSAISNCADLRIASWDNANTYWEKSDNSDNVNTTGLCTGTNSGTIYSTSNLSQFRAFTFGNSTITVLPISLISFEVTQKMDQVIVEWSTATENNNSYFTIERTIDGQYYTEIEEVEGAGNHLGVRNYKTIDQRPFEGISYYRLSQTDYDGKKVYYPLKSIQLSNKIIKEVRIYPNPTQSNSSIHITSKINQIHPISIKITSLTGEILYLNELKLEPSKGTVSFQLPNTLKTGIFLIHYTIDNQTEVEKLIVND